MLYINSPDVCTIVQRTYHAFGVVRYFPWTAWMRGLIPTDMSTCTSSSSHVSDLRIRSAFSLSVYVLIVYARFAASEGDDGSEEISRGGDCIPTSVGSCRGRCDGDTTGKAFLYVSAAPCGSRFFRADDSVARRFVSAFPIGEVRLRVV